MTDTQKLINWINESEKIVFFGGAGVSTGSGLKDFRGKDGLYNEKKSEPVEYYLSHECFFLEPEVFYNFYKLHPYLKFHLVFFFGI